MKKHFIIIGMFFWCGCATPITHYTPSGRPEVTIKGVTLQVVGSELINEMVNVGYKVIKQSDNLLVFDHRSDNVLAAVFFGSRYDSIPNYRVTYTLIRAGDSVRIIADCDIVTNPGSAFERLTNLNNTEVSSQMQTFLQRTRQRLESLEQTVEPKSQKDIQISTEKENAIYKTSIKENTNGSSEPREEPQFIGVCAQCGRRIGKNEKICMSGSKLLCPECFKKTSENR